MMSLFDIVNSSAVYLTRSLAVQTVVPPPDRPSDICFSSDVYTQIVTCLGRAAARWRQQLLFWTLRLSITVTDTHTYSTLLFYTLLSNFYHNPQIHFRSLSFIHIFSLLYFIPCERTLSSYNWRPTELNYTIMLFWLRWGKVRGRTRWLNKTFITLKSHSQYLFVTRRQGAVPFNVFAFE